MEKDIVNIVLDFYRSPSRYEYLMDPAGQIPENFDDLLEVVVGEHQQYQSGVSEALSLASPFEFIQATLNFVEKACFIKGASYYRILGLNPDTMQEKIKLHYDLLLKLFCLDRADMASEWNPEYALKLNQAYSILRDPQKRYEYDQKHQFNLDNRGRQFDQPKMQPHRSQSSVSLEPESVLKFPHSHDREAVNDILSDAQADSGEFNLPNESILNKIVNKPNEADSVDAGRSSRSYIADNIGRALSNKLDSSESEIINRPVEGKKENHKKTKKNPAQPQQEISIQFDRYDKELRTDLNEFSSKEVEPLNIEFDDQPKIVKKYIMVGVLVLGVFAGVYMLTQLTLEPTERQSVVEVSDKISGNEIVVVKENDVKISVDSEKREVVEKVNTISKPPSDKSQNKLQLEKKKISVEKKVASIPADVVANTVVAKSASLRAEKAQQPIKQIPLSVKTENVDKNDAQPGVDAVALSESPVKSEIIASPVKKSPVASTVKAGDENLIEAVKPKPALNQTDESGKLARVAIENGGTSIAAVASGSVGNASGTVVVDEAVGPLANDEEASVAEVVSNLNGDAKFTSEIEILDPLQTHYGKLDLLLKAFTNSYQIGDLSMFISLFSADAKTEDQQNRDGIKGDYKALFDGTEERQMRLSSMKWASVNNNQAVGVGDFSVDLVPKGGGEPVNVSGIVTLNVQYDEQGYVITRMAHSTE